MDKDKDKDRRIIISRDRNMVTAVKRWISYEVGNGSSVGAVVFRWIDDE